MASGEIRAPVTGHGGGGISLRVCGRHVGRRGAFARAEEADRQPARPRGPPGPVDGARDPVSAKQVSPSPWCPMRDHEGKGGGADSAAARAAPVMRRMFMPAALK